MGWSGEEGVEGGLGRGGVVIAPFASPTAGELLISLGEGEKHLLFR